MINEKNILLSVLQLICISLLLSGCGLPSQTISPPLDTPHPVTVIIDFVTSTSIAPRTESAKVTLTVEPTGRPQSTEPIPTIAPLGIELKIVKNRCKGNGELIAATIGIDVVGGLAKYEHDIQVISSTGGPTRFYNNLREITADPGDTIIVSVVSDDGQKTIDSIVVPSECNADIEDPSYELSPKPSTNPPSTNPPSTNPPSTNPPSTNSPSTNPPPTNESNCKPPGQGGTPPGQGGTPPGQCNN